MRFSEQQGELFFEVALKPMKVEKSYRFAQRFDAERFCVIGIPRISSEYLPYFLKDGHIPFRDGIINRLVDTDFHSRVGSGALSILNQRTLGRCFVETRGQATSNIGCVSSSKTAMALSASRSEADLRAH